MRCRLVRILHRNLLRLKSSSNSSDYPKSGSDGSYPVEKTKAISGGKLLRSIMSDNQIEFYAAYGKVINCGGGGSCGTCIVEIIDGKDLLNERTDTELKYLKRKPESWRLACQTIVGNKENSESRLGQKPKSWNLEGCGSEVAPVEEMIRSQAADNLEVLLTTSNLGNRLQICKHNACMTANFCAVLVLVIQVT